MCPQPVGLDQAPITRLLTAGAGDQKADRAPGHARGLDEQVLAFQGLQTGREEDIVVGRLTAEAIGVVGRVIQGLRLEPVAVAETLRDPARVGETVPDAADHPVVECSDAVAQPSLVRGRPGLVIELVSGAVLVHKP